MKSYLTNASKQPLTKWKYQKNTTTARMTTTTTTTTTTEAEAEAAQSTTTLSPQITTNGNKQQKANK